MFLCLILKINPYDDNKNAAYKLDVNYRRKTS